MEKVVNNDDKVLKRVEDIIKERGWKNVSSWSDDGSVGVNVEGGVEEVRLVAGVLFKEIGDIEVGDGVQRGSLWINNGDSISGEWSEFVLMEDGGDIVSFD